MPTLPSARGSLSARLLSELVGEVHELAPMALGPTATPLDDEDLQLALYLCYELHYRGLAGVDDRWEWEPSLLRLRREMEETFERALLDAVPYPAPLVGPDATDLALRAIVQADSPLLSAFVRSRASVEQIREFCVHRSAYQLKEADPHSWAIPRLFGAPKAALVEVQADEYGGGQPERIHAELFARTLRALGLDSSYGAYLDVIPAVTLATVNLMSFFGLQRRWRGAIVGHLAAFEMTSSIPNRRYANGLRRLGFGTEATEFFDEHVVADAAHEQIAAVDLVGGLVRQDASQCGPVLWGALTLTYLENRWAEHLLRCWRDGRSSLLRDLDRTAHDPDREPVPS